MVEGNSGYEMVYDMSFDDVVEKRAAYEAEFPIEVAPRAKVQV